MNKEHGTLLKELNINGKEYRHVIFSQDDDRVELQDAVGNTLIKYTANGYVLNKKGVMLGHIRSLHEYKLCFISNTPMIADMEFEEHSYEIYLHFEYKISEKYIKVLDAQHALKDMAESDKTC